MIFDPKAHIPLMADNEPSYHDILMQLNQRAAGVIIGGTVVSYHNGLSSDPDAYPLFTSDDTGDILYWPELDANGRRWSPATHIADAMELLYCIGHKEYMKWGVTDSYYHGKSVHVSPPCESMSGYEEGMRDSFSWCCDEEELPEHITRAVLYAMGDDVETHDVYRIAKGQNNWDITERSAAYRERDARADEELLAWLKVRHPEWLRQDGAQIPHEGDT